MRTAQELYETVVKNLRQQGEKSHLKDANRQPVSYSCRYRDPEGRKCAIGWLIADEFYSPRIEGKLVADLLTLGLLPLPLAAEFQRYKKLLQILQSIHDTGASLADWEKQWRMVADDFQLKYPVPNED